MITATVMKELSNFIRVHKRRFCCFCLIAYCCWNNSCKKMSANSSTTNFVSLRFSYILTARINNIIIKILSRFNSLSANYLKWSNTHTHTHTHTQTVRQKPTNCVNVFDLFVALAVKGLRLGRINNLLFLG